MAHNFWQKPLKCYSYLDRSFYIFLISFWNILAGQRCLRGYVSELQMLGTACDGVDSNCYLNTYSFLLFSRKGTSKRVEIAREGGDLR